MKTMMKKTVAALAIALAAHAVQADDSYLYWMLGDTMRMVWSGDVVDNYNYAMVSLDGNYLSMYEGSSPVSQEIDRGVAELGPTYWGVIDTANVTDNSSFVFELYLDDGSSSTLSYSVAKTYAELLPYIGNSQTPTTGGAYTLSVVPEPTSGLLMLLGFAGLALRRRKQV